MAPSAVCGKPNSESHLNFGSPKRRSEPPLAHARIPTGLGCCRYMYRYFAGDSETFLRNLRFAPFGGAVPRGQQGPLQLSSISATDADGPTDLS